MYARMNRWFSWRVVGFPEGLRYLKAFDVNKPAPNVLYQSILMVCAFVIAFETGLNYVIVGNLKGEFLQIWWMPEWVRILSCFQLMPHCTAVQSLDKIYGDNRFTWVNIAIDAILTIRKYVFRLGFHQRRWSFSAKVQKWGYVYFCVRISYWENIILFLKGQNSLKDCNLHRSISITNTHWSFWLSACHETTDHGGI